jgi:hypothetical protein
MCNTNQKCTVWKHQIALSGVDMVCQNLPWLMQFLYGLPSPNLTLCNFGFIQCSWVCVVCCWNVTYGRIKVHGEKPDRVPRCSPLISPELDWCWTQVPMLLKIKAFWEMAPYQLIISYQCFYSSFLLSSSGGPRIFWGRTGCTVEGGGGLGDWCREPLEVALWSGWSHS